LKAVQNAQRGQMFEHEREAAEQALQRRLADEALLALSRASAAGWPN
jgi:hypothetical protein